MLRRAGLPADYASSSTHAHGRSFFFLSCGLPSGLPIHPPICTPTHLVVNGVELGKHDAVDAAPAGGTGRRSGRRSTADTGQRSGRQLLQGTVELGQLVHCIIADLREGVCKGG